MQTARQKLNSATEHDVVRLRFARPLHEFSRDINNPAIVRGGAVRKGRHTVAFFVFHRPTGDLQ